MKWKHTTKQSTFRLHGNCVRIMFCFFFFNEKCRLWNISSLKSNWNAKLWCDLSVKEIVASTKNTSFYQHDVESSKNYNVNEKNCTLWKEPLKKKKKKDTRSQQQHIARAGDREREKRNVGKRYKTQPTLERGMVQNGNVRQNRIKTNQANRWIEIGGTEKQWNRDGERQTVS